MNISKATQLGRSGLAFTLIELLVVIAIIALLISILLPSLAGAKESARTAVCQTKVHGFYLALAMYAEDNKGECVWAWNGPYEWTLYGGACYGGYTWAAMLYPYAKSLAAYECPSFKPPQAIYSEPYDDNPVLMYTKYRVNPYLGCRGYGPGGIAGWSFDDPKFHCPQINGIKQPSDKVFLFDALEAWKPYMPTAGWGETNHAFINALGDNDRSNPLNYDVFYADYHRSPNIGIWHKKATNVTFMDGHVEWTPWNSKKTFYDLTDYYWQLP